MADQQQQTREQSFEDPLRGLLDGGAFDEAGHIKNAPALIPSTPPAGLVEFVVAQNIPSQQRRSYARILERLKVLANAAGERWVYGWDVNDRRRNRKVHIEGPTIKCANAVVREYGNVAVDVRVAEQGEHYMFYARLVDLESGSNWTRAYQQRKGQEIGMEDAQRAADIVFQIGQSKAIRNVVVNALSDIVEYCVEEAKKAIIGKVAKDPEGARKAILEALERRGIDRRRVEAVYGRTAANWTNPDMARIYTELRSVQENMVLPDDVWPPLEPAADRGKEETGKQERKGASRPPRQAQGQPKAGEGGEGAGPKGAPAGEPDGDLELTGKHAGAPNLHIVDRRNVVLGSVGLAAAHKLGADIELADGKRYRIIEINEYPAAPGDFVAMVDPINAPATNPASTASGPPKADEQHSTERTQGAPNPLAEAPAGRGKRPARGAGGPLFSSDS